MTAGGVVNFARKFKSTPGKKDGLYWSAAENEPASLFGALVAEAHAEGYVKGKPFVWTASVESIVEKLSRCTQTLERIKPGCTRHRMRKTKEK